MMNFDSTLSSTAEPAVPGSNTKRRPKTFQCRYCPDIFHRLEHIQRHERTHTKEKPFSCACGKAFSRRDLLLRHEKLVHDMVSRRNTRRVRTSTDVSSPSLATNQTSGVTDMHPEWAAHEPSSFPSSFPPQELFSNAHESPASRSDIFAGQIDHQPLDVVPSLAPTYGDNNDFVMSGTVDIPGDYNLFFDNFDISNFYLPATVYDSELPVSLWSRPNEGLHVEHQSISERNSSNGNDALSQFGSRLPSLRPEEQNLMESEPSPQADFLRAGPAWKVTGQDHRTIQNKLKDFSTVLPEDFILPSRHTLSRYFEGYITGFNQHLPFLHIPSFSVSRFVPELVLAIAAVGAQYRFESARGNKLWYAAKSVAIEQLRRRQSQQVANILSSPTPRRTSLSTSPTSQASPAYRDASNSNSSSTLQAARASNGLRSTSAQARLGTIQTLLILMAMGMWGPPPLLREATSIQNQLALLIREHGLQTIDRSDRELSWEEWVLFESDCRTKCIAYCFFNLHSIAYDNPPVLRTSEVKINLPHSAEEWRAASAEEWSCAQRNSPQEPLSFHHILSKLYSADKEYLLPISSLGNYVLIHAIIQQIYIIRQASTIPTPTTLNGSLQPSEISKLGEALRIWQIGWEKAPESSLDPTNPYGPIAFSSTALLRLAYIRLHCDLGPCRGLDTRDPKVIARTLKACPPLMRSSMMSRAILQAAHALSIPVKIGIKFVAHTHTLLWSMQHSLGNLECAFLLSRWLYMIAGFMEDLTIDERNLLEMVRSIVGETHYAIEPEDGNIGNDSMEVKQLSVAVVRIWAEVFTGSHHVFPLVKVIGLALEGYADLCEAEHGMGN